MENYFPTILKSISWYRNLGVGDKLSIPTFIIVVWTLISSQLAATQSSKNELALSELMRTKELYEIRRETAMALKRLECYGKNSSVPLYTDKKPLLASYSEELKLRFKDYERYNEESISNPDKDFHIASVNYMQRLDKNMHLFDVFTELRGQLSNDEIIRLENLCNLY